VLCALEHFGLGSYGDRYDPHADEQAITEMIRVPTPGGHLVLSTLCAARRESFIVFNTQCLCARALA
jgi:hypothetical protein